MRCLLLVCLILLSSCAVRRTNVGLVTSPEWLDLQPGMELRIEGTNRIEAAWEVQPDGTLAGAQRFISSRDQRRRYHRLFFQIVMSRSGSVRPAILLSAHSVAELNRQSKGSTEFPSTLTASVVIGIVVNGEARKVVWGSTVGNVAPRATSVELLRIQNGRLAPVAADTTKPVLPGDRITYGLR